MEGIPKLPGSYALHLHLRVPLTIDLGALGRFSFPAGEYIYLGSARGPGGLRGRLKRHRYGGNTQRWHVDYLRAAAEPAGCWYTLQESAEPPLECLWSQELARLPGAAIPALGFGASDCRLGCPAHLVAFPLNPHEPFLESLWAEVQWQPMTKILHWEPSQKAVD